MGEAYLISPCIQQPQSQTAKVDYLFILKDRAPMQKAFWGLRWLFPLSRLLSAMSSDISLLRFLMHDEQLIAAGLGNDFNIWKS